MKLSKRTKKNMVKNTFTAVDMLNSSIFEAVPNYCPPTTMTQLWEEDIILMVDLKGGVASAMPSAQVHRIKSDEVKTKEWKAPSYLSSSLQDISDFSQRRKCPSCGEELYARHDIDGVAEWHHQSGFCEVKPMNYILGDKHPEYLLDHALHLGGYQDEELEEIVIEEESDTSDSDINPFWNYSEEYNPDMDNPFWNLQEKYIPKIKLRKEFNIDPEVQSETSRSNLKATLEWMKKYSPKKFDEYKEWMSIHSEEVRRIFVDHSDLASKDASEVPLSSVVDDDGFSIPQDFHSDQCSDHYGVGRWNIEHTTMSSEETWLVGNGHNRGYFRSQILSLSDKVAGKLMFKLQEMAKEGNSLAQELFEIGCSIRSNPQMRIGRLYWLNQYELNQPMERLAPSVPYSPWMNIPRGSRGTVKHKPSIYARPNCPYWDKIGYVPETQPIVKLDRKIKKVTMVPISIMEDWEKESRMQENCVCVY